MSNTSLFKVLIFLFCGHSVAFCGVSLSQIGYNDRSVHFIVSLPVGKVGHTASIKGSSVTILFSGLSMMELQTGCLQQGPHTTPLSVRCLVAATPRGEALLELDLAALEHPVVTLRSHAGLRQLVVGIHDAAPVCPAAYDPPLCLV